MLAARNPVAGDPKPRPKSARKPLQPKNIQSYPAAELTKPPLKPKQESARAPAPATPPPAAAKIETIDASLAEELCAIRKRLERLRAERDRTERDLKERDSILDRHRKEIERRGAIQKSLEIEVDRLYRLNQLHCQAMLRFSPIRSLREKEQAKIAESPSKNLKIEYREETEEEEVEEKEEPLGESSPQQSSNSTENK